MDEYAYDPLVRKVKSETWWPIERQTLLFIYVIREDLEEQVSG
jgi:hypothetical protein